MQTEPNKKPGKDHKIEEADLATSLEDVAKGLDNKPGVYLFCSDKKILYVGKARNLRKRVASYMKITRLDNKSRRLMEKANRLQWVITASTTEALLLEYNFIKQHKPPYNIALRDDKSYPFIYLSGNHKFPLLRKHRGPQNRTGKYFGPYPSAGAVDMSITELQKIFQLRSCTDSFFANRRRPCLQHQIDRCSAPCVDGISEEEYAKNVKFATDFLAGKSDEVIKELTEEMRRASEEMQFEQAAKLRDKVQAMRNLSSRQYVSRQMGDLDALAIYSHGEHACVYIIKVRDGKLSDSQHFFFRTPAFDTEESLMQQFLGQYYLSAGNKLPREITTSIQVPEEIFADLREHFQRPLAYKPQVRGVRKRWLSMAIENCKSLLVTHINSRSTYADDFAALGKTLGAKIAKIECFDISHSSGTQTQGSCVVFNEEGSHKQDYRRFNITEITPGDDYAAMQQVVYRHYSKPDKIMDAKADATAGIIILIDGGLGQLKAGLKGLHQLYAEAEAKGETGSFKFLANSIIIGVAKDKDRRFGKEKLLILKELIPEASGPPEEISGKIDSIELSAFNKTNYWELLLKVRDEAHRFAITGHRKKRDASASKSVLDAVDGLGETRKRELIRHFGGISMIKEASVEELARVPGFGNKLAQEVFKQLRK